jgi:hypothetical protein
VPLFQRENVLLFDAGDVNVFDDVLRQRTRFAGGVDINGRDAALRVDTAAQGAAAVDNRHADFRFRRFALFEAIDRLPAGEAGNFIDDRRAGARGDIDNLFPATASVRAGRPSRRRLFQCEYGS